jgi:predicted small lipoprotein YifL
MRKFLFLLPVFIMMGIFTSCGKKGPILPPVPKIPQKISQIEVVQRGQKIILMWNNPTAYLDGSPLTAISEIGIWLNVSPAEETTAGSPVDFKRFNRRARLDAALKMEDFSRIANTEKYFRFEFQYIYKLTGSASLLRRHTFGIKVKDRRGRISEYSDLRALDPVMLSLPPRKPRAITFKDRIEVHWDSPNENIDRSSPPNFKGYNIYRAVREGEQLLLNSGLVEGTQFEDRDVLIGNTYQYVIRTTATLSPPFFESDDSEVVEIIFEDIFPPAIPTGLMTVAGESFIALSWEIPRDTDLAGFHVWRRAEGEEEFVLITSEPIWENAYSDSLIEENKKYHYAVTSVDRSGNESQKSEPVSDTIKEGSS